MKIIFLQITIAYYIIFCFDKHVRFVISLTKLLFKSKRERVYKSVVPYDIIVHRNRLGGLVRNPVNGLLEHYNINHPLYLKTV